MDEILIFLLKREKERDKTSYVLTKIFKKYIFYS